MKQRTVSTQNIEQQSCENMPTKRSRHIYGE